MQNDSEFNSQVKYLVWLLAEAGAQYRCLCPTPQPSAIARVTEKKGVATASI